MSGNQNPDQGPAGLRALPRRWAVVVQLVSTFGLAVFLVLYYVLAIQPREAKRYDRLRDSVESLMSVVEKGHVLVTKDQARNLEDLYILAVSHELTGYILPKLETEPATEELKAGLEDIMVVHTSYFQGLVREGGGVISEALTHKIRNGEISEMLARSIAEGKIGTSRTEITDQCRKIVEFELRKVAMIPK